ncbi:hypothetical protein C8R43DRAFT_1133309 [Mycena crocata]|nr:hypothetical protein C8R43DRAFT_1133309 [Mycena crocata]
MKVRPVEATLMHPPKGDTSPAIVAAAGDDMPAPRPSAGPQYTEFQTPTARNFLTSVFSFRPGTRDCDDGEHDHPANPALRSGGQIACASSRVLIAPRSSTLTLTLTPPSSPAGDAQAASLDSTAGVAVMSYGVRVDGQGEIFTTAAEARRSFQMLQQAGRNPSLMITESVDVCMRWIEETPWDGVASGQSQSWAEGEDRARRERVRERVASQVASQRVREERRRHILVALDAERADRMRTHPTANESVGSDTSRSTADLETELEYRAARSAWRRLSS